MRIASVSLTKLLRTPSKRSAATKATQKLHDVIMPDVVSFQKEMKKGVVRAIQEDVTDGKGKTPVKTPAPKGRKRRSIGSKSLAEEEDEDEDMPERKKRKPDEIEETAKAVTKEKRKAGRQSAAAESGVLEDQEVRPAKKTGTVTTANNGVAKEVRVMTTQLTLSEDVVRVSEHILAVQLRSLRRCPRD